MIKRSYVPILTRTGETYKMDVTTREIRRTEPKNYRSKKERVRAQRAAFAKLRKEQGR